MTLEQLVDVVAYLKSLMSGGDTAEGHHDMGGSMKMGDSSVKMGGSMK